MVTQKCCKFPFILISKKVMKRISVVRECLDAAVSRTPTACGRGCRATSSKSFQIDVDVLIY